ncbi:hypothetical protein [Cupriavidus metallidurans]|uniref:DUF4175 domain-containing protein n=1 Tax=Cupriavidus metallidurans (strain ATCC 43123 / DSM 2839 / NBRC 102507 / CH34) TaxID=266264 RepID=Q1LNM7_CUPMC|nr:conserved hypothetical protein; putative membrane protein [Cupriavidus metallidurans CH34]
MMGTRWLAGSLLGLPLAIALCTLGILWLPGGRESGVVVAIMLGFMLWVAIICLSLLFASSRSAWLWLLGANLICYGVLWGVRVMHLMPPASPLSGA